MPWGTEPHQSVPVNFCLKLDEIVEYEKRLKAATFAYSKAESKSARGQKKAPAQMFNEADTLFERLAEYLNENIAGHGDLETWFDRSVETGFENRFSLTPNDFPQVITSRSLKNTGGGYVSFKRTISKVKMDAVQRALEQLAAPEAEDSVDLNERMVRFAALMKRAGD